jgi:hypothetical protein
MFGRKPKLTPLQARKQLLLVESEINRAQLAADWSALRDEAHACLVKGKSSISTVVSATAMTAAGLSIAGKVFSMAGGNKTGLISKVFGLAKIGTSLWLAYRQRPTTHSD